MRRCAMHTPPSAAGPGSDGFVGNLNPDRRADRQLFFLAVGTVVALLSLTLFLTLRLEASRHGDAVQNAGHLITRFVTGAETSLNRSMLGVDTLLVSVDDLLQLSGNRRGRLDPDQTNRLLRASVEQNLLVRYVALLNEHGEVLASSDPQGHRLDVRVDPKFLRQIVGGPGYTVHVGAPHADGLEGETVLFVGRMVRLPGNQQVVVLAQLPVALLRTVMAQGIGVEGLEMTLEREDGMLLVSLPPSMGNEGKVQDVGTRGPLVSGLVEKLHSRLSGAQAFVAARRTLYMGVWVTAAMPVSVALAPWELERRYIWSVSGLVMFLIVSMGALLGWYFHRIRRATRRVALANTMLDQALNSMSSGFVVIDAQMRLVRWNRRYEDMTPGAKGRLRPMMAVTEVFAMVSRALLPAETTEDEHARWVAQRMAYLQVSQDSELAYPDGRHLHVAIRGTPEGGKVAVLTDVTEERNTQADLRVAAKVFDSQEGMMVTDPQRRIVRVNHAFTQITGYDAHEVVGRDPKLLNAGVQDAGVVRAMWEALVQHGHWQGEVINRRKDGEIFHAQLTITSVKDDAGRISHYVATMLDITSRKHAAQEIERLAFYDPLTELPNRRLLMDRLRQALAGSARSGQYGALLFLDLDHFKVLNDTLGHDVGDVLLRTVAQRLKSSLRETDTVARLGGDEFVVLLNGLSERVEEAADTTRSTGEKILRALIQPIHLAAHDYPCSTSIGAVLFMGQQVSLDDLLKQADLAMYDAKAAGRGTLRFFDPQMQAAMAERAALEKDLRRAVDERQFELHYQAQVTHERSVVGAEVLLRWRHPTRGMVSPLQFITLAEETGLIVGIGAWVLHAACTQLALWQKDARFAHLQLAVNVSALQFQQHDFVEQVVRTLEHTGADPRALKLELTESAVVQNVHDIIDKMNRLKLAGVGFSMDDFGTGQSSLSYLTKLPLDQLKIDQSFVRNIGIRHADALMVQTIIGMAQSLGLQVVAEGVETEAQRAFLQEHQCSVCQGYLFARPQPLVAFEQSLLSGFEATIGPVIN